MRRLFITKFILTIFAGLGAAGALLRFATGLGAASNLSNGVPWGLWIGFDDMAGVALASGGFIITAMVYIFRLERFRPVLRSTLLTAFLGYCLVPFSLLLDIGLPWNIWHPLVYWQFHSVLFTVSLCVMLFSAILAMFFLLTLLEHPLFALPFLKKVHGFIHRNILVIVIIGIAVSVLHQSSLGSLFLIMPHRAHPLWYTPLLSVQYFVSAVGLGCSMIIFESTATSFLYKHHSDKKLLRNLARISSIVVLIYGAIRILDLATRHELISAVNGSWQSNLFLFEMGLSVALPAVIYNINFFNSRIRWLFMGACFVILGFILNRIDLSFVTIIRPEGTRYFPSIIEIATSVGMISAGALVFFFFVEHLDLFEGKFLFKPAPEISTAIGWHPMRGVRTGIINSISLYTLGFILAVSFGFAAFYTTASPDRKYRPVPTEKAAALPDGKTLRINNGNNLIFADFNHAGHQDSLGKKESCVKCHHMSVRAQEITPCYLCHTDMYKSASIFNHHRHERVYRDSGSCKVCHPGARTKRTFRPCKDCHQAMFPEKLAAGPLQFIAPAYIDAMHKSCIPCHVREWPKRNKPTPDYCNTCHKNRESDIWTRKYVIEVENHRRDSLATIDRLMKAQDSLSEVAKSPLHGKRAASSGKNIRP